MSSLVSANQVVTGQVQSLDSVRAHALPSDAMIFASATKVQPANQNPGSYAIVESGVNSLGVTTTGSVPAVTQSPFADLYKEGSIYFNGTAGNYLQNTAVYSNSTIQWNTTGMTVEAWVNYQAWPSITTPALIGIMTPASTADYWSFGSNNIGYVTFQYYGNSATQVVAAQTPLSLNTWNHIAMTCSTSGQIFLFVNGIQSQVIATRGGVQQAASYYETAQSVNAIVSNPLAIGQYNSSAINAYVADIRLTTGTPVYTGSTSSYATFTVPSAPLSATLSPGVTQFLLRAGQNSPTLQSGALTFDRGLKQFANFGPMTYNMYTRGFTCVFNFQFNGTVANNERLLQFTQSTSSPNNSFAILRNGTGSTLSFSYYNNSGTPTTVTTSTTLSQATTYVLALVYSGSTIQWWINGAPDASGTLTLAADPSLYPYTYIGCDYTSTANCISASMNTLAIYNRALSNVEIYNAYLALNTVQQNRTVEFGDVNGTPALSIAGDGRVNVTKLGQTSNTLPWPPAAMTGYVTSINGGTYVASASSEYNSSYLAWYAFDKSSSTSWLSSATYTTSTGGYTGTVTTTDVNGTVYLGEWVQFQNPTQILVSSCSITPASSSYTYTSPVRANLLGSRDGVNWFLVGTLAAATWTTSAQTFSFSSNQSFIFFRLVINTINAANTQAAAIQELVFNGTADTAQPLTVAQPMTLSYGAQTASLTGIANPGVFVPQDFSSSGLNIPAYVVSNTATVANTVAYSSFGPFAGEGSLYFPGGTGAYVNFGNQLPVWPSTALMDATFEAWIYLTQQSTVNMIFNRTTTLTSGSNDWGLYVNGSGVLYNVMYNNGKGSNAQASLAGVPVNAWTHVAWSFKSGVSTVFINGTASSASSSISSVNYTSSALTTIGQYNNTTGNMFNGYIASARIISGLALYQSAFTPPTAPLQPIQGTTQAGLPYGTVLLLRNAPSPGRVLTQKFSGANTTGVNGSPLTLAFPPAAMTGYSTTLNAGYGQGTYVASASAEFSGSNLAWYAFDKNTGTQWGGQSGQYTGSGSFPWLYVGGAPPKTVDVNGNSYTGDWIQIQMPSSIVLSSYSIYYNTSYACPGLFYILGSRDGTNWTLVDQRTQAPPSSSGYITFSVSSSQAFTYFRLQAYGVTTTGGTLNVFELIFNGTIEGPTVSADGRLGVGVSAPVQQLEVAGSAVVAGTLSAGNPLMFRNALYNGDMRITQRGTSFAGPSAVYTLDRWFISNYGAAGAYYTISQIQSGLANFSNAFQLQQTSTSNMNAWLIQGLETRDVVRFQGQPVTVSFWYRIPTSFTQTWNASLNWSTSVDTRLAPPSEGTYASILYLTNPTVWTYASFTAFVPSTAQALSVMFYTTNSTVNGATIQITGVQLEKGTVATPFEVRPYAVELQLCQRYWEQSYAYGTAAATNTTTGAVVVSGTSDGSSNIYYTLKYAVPKRTAVTPTFYTNAGASGWQLVISGGAGTAVPTTYGAATTMSYTLYMNATVTWSAAQIFGHWVANAEL